MIYFYISFGLVLEDTLHGIELFGREMDGYLGKV